MRPKHVITIATVALVAGYTIPRPTLNELWLCVRNPAAMLHYELQQTSFDLFRFQILDRHQTEVGIFDALHNQDSQDLRSFMEYHLASLAEQRVEIANTFSIMKKHMDQGGTLYEYHYRNGEELGILILNRGKIVYKVPIVGTLVE